MREVPVAVVELERLTETIGPQRARLLADLAARSAQEFAGRRIWNVNSTASGGGVAEMLEQVVSYSRSADVDARWLVMDGTPEFFTVTKRLHNRLHGEPGDGGPLGPEEQAVYADVTERAGAELARIVAPGDVVVLHDPQPLGAARAARDAGASVVWRVHIGTDIANGHTHNGWAFLEPFHQLADEVVVSRAAYRPPFCGPDDCVVIAPGIDPLSPKNAPMPQDVVAAIVEHLGVFHSTGGTTVEPRYTRDGGGADVIRRRASLFGASGRPSTRDRVVMQVSRWDRLKDMAGVMVGFAEWVLGGSRPASDAWLLLVGPATDGVADDPEGAAVYAECQTLWAGLPDRLRERILLVSLPMDERDENAAMVNALQRSATVVTQKSLKEGFGLTVSEAMWKSRPVVAAAVGGIVDQLVEGTGELVADPTDLRAFGTAVAGLVADADRAAALGRAGMERVRARFLPDRQLTEWAAVLSGVLRRRSAP